jgi:hypothetical protein
MDHESAMLAFATLADLAQAKRQFFPRDKFLILAGAAACRAGCLEVAARCRELVALHNPAHLLNGYDSLPDALRDDEFQAFLKQLLKFCSYERAEHLLQHLNIAPAARCAARGLTANESAAEILAGPQWDLPSEKPR